MEPLSGNVWVTLAYALAGTSLMLTAVSICANIACFWILMGLGNNA